MLHLRRAPVAIAFAALAHLASSAEAIVIVVNNGLAPPDPANVFDASDGLLASDQFYVTNVGCDQFGCTAVGAPTSASFEGGITTGFVAAQGSSSVAINGATVASVSASGTSQATINAGLIVDSVTAFESGTVVWNGGVANGHLFASNQAIVQMTGGAAAGLGASSLSGNASLFLTGGNLVGGISTLGTALLEIDGGAIGGFSVLRSSTAAVLHSGALGGSQGEATTIGTGAQLEYLGGQLFGEVGVSGLLRIFGSNFLLDGVPIGFGAHQIANVSTLTGTVTSTGHSFRINVATFGGGSIELVPEPSTAVLTALGLGALALRGRRSRRSN